ncbi:MAG: hypothetical protein L3K13_04480 [Thermoplasmata archaeon]|nr:hypothetical protein [Thermoplasmata archaeon]
MATLGSREYPEYSFSQCLRYVDEAKKQKITTLAAFLPILGHTNPNSGGVGLKLSSMGKFYRILEKDGKSIKFTPLGEKIVYDVGGRGRAHACFEAVSGVSLLKDLYSRLGPDYNSQDFSPVLQELSGAKPAELELRAEDIEKLYRDAVQYLRTPDAGGGTGAELRREPSTASLAQDNSKEELADASSRASALVPRLPEGDNSENYHIYTSGGTYVRVAKDPEVLSGIQWMVRGWLKQEGGAARRSKRKDTSNPTAPPPTG